MLRKPIYAESDDDKRNEAKVLHLEFEQTKLDALACINAALTKLLSISLPSVLDLVIIAEYTKDLLALLPITDRFQDSNKIDLDDSISSASSFHSPSPITVSSQDAARIWRTPEISVSKSPGLTFFQEKTPPSQKNTHSDDLRYTPL